MHSSRVNTDLSGHKSVITCEILQDKSFQLLFGSSELTFVLVIILHQERRSDSLFLFCFFVPISLLVIHIRQHELKCTCATISEERLVCS